MQMNGLGFWPPPPPLPMRTSSRGTLRSSSRVAPSLWATVEAASLAPIVSHAHGEAAHRAALRGQKLELASVGLLLAAAKRCGPRAPPRTQAKFVRLPAQPACLLACLSSCSGRAQADAKLISFRWGSRERPLRALLLIRGRPARATKWARQARSLVQLVTRSRREASALENQSSSARARFCETKSNV